MTARPHFHVSFGVQVSGPTAELADVARRVEHAGLDRVLVPDHPGLTDDPFVALAFMAAATERLRLGTYVLNAGVREPWQVASAAASLQAACGGRFELGIGAGHTPSEWRLAGRDQPSARVRVQRLQEFVELVSALLGGGPVTAGGEHFACQDGTLSDHPVDVPILVGGNGPRVLTIAAQHAQVVSLTGFGATQPDGHTHAVLWSEEALSRRVAMVTEAATRQPPGPEIEVLVQHVELTAHREAAAAKLLDEGIPGLDLPTALNTPFVLLGTTEQIAEQLRRWHDSHGINRYVVRTDAIDAASQIMRALD